MPKYEIKVFRSFPEGEATIEIDAPTEEEAMRLAIEQAMGDPALYFDPLAAPEYGAEFIGEIEEE